MPDNAQPRPSDTNVLATQIVKEATEGDSPTNGEETNETDEPDTPERR
jgi:hypothetical protein